MISIQKNRICVGESSPSDIVQRLVLLGFFLLVRHDKNELCKVFKTVRGGAGCGSHKGKQKKKLRARGKQRKIPLKFRKKIPC
jgi:hypothetical protein